MEKNRSKSNLKVKKYRRQKAKLDNITKNKRQQDKQNANSANIVFGIDNGSTGTICCMIPSINYIDFIETPSRQCLDYPQQIQYIARIDVKELLNWFKKNIKKAQQFYKSNLKSIVILQRPMVNPQRFKQSGFALRAFEATLLVLEQLELNYIVIDSKKWQHYFFGKNTLQIDLKQQSKKLGLNIIQNNIKQDQKENSVMRECIIKHGDADGLLICKFGIQKLV